MSENRVLRGMFGPERDEVTAGLRKLQSEELHSSYPSLNFNRINEDDITGACSTHERHEQCMQGDVRKT